MVYTLSVLPMLVIGVEAHGTLSRLSQISTARWSVQMDRGVIQVGLLTLRRWHAQEVNRYP